MTSPRPRPLALLIVLVAALTLVTGCAGTDTASRKPSSSSTSSTSSASSAPSASPIDTQTKSAQKLLDEWAAQGRGGAAVALARNDKELTVAAAGSVGPEGGRLRPDAQFRVGSLSKTFVAVMVLQLVDEQKIGLDDLVVDHVPKLTIADGVTIRQLLAHRTGIPEYADGELAPAVLADPAATWTPADVLALVDHQPRDFAPGTQFAYSNTNYIIAGLLLEAVTGQTLADNLQSRIVKPLGLRATYFAPDDKRSPIGAFSHSLPGGDTSGASYRALETSAGAAGALVSTAPDLATVMRALAHGDLLDPTTYNAMTTGLPASGHTLGLFAADPASATGISNSGAVPGFIAYMQYDPATEDLFVLLINDDTHSPETLGTALTELTQTK